MADVHRPDDPAASWNRPRHPRGRKDRKRWCRGKEGVEHVLDLVRARSVGSGRCRWIPYVRGPREGMWMCGHVWQCLACGRKFHGVTVECPDWAGSDG